MVITHDTLKRFEQTVLKLATFTSPMIHYDTYADLILHKENVFVEKKETEYTE